MISDEQLEEAIALSKRLMHVGTAMSELRAVWHVRGRSASSSLPLVRALDGESRRISERLWELNEETEK